MTNGHKPVLLEEVVAAIAPRDGAIYVDGTFGGGGYSRALLDTADCRVVGIDRDPAAASRAEEWRDAYGDRLMLLEGCFGDMAGLLADEGIETVNGVTLDLGVSSYQLDEAARGFSFRADGPLDMRMSAHGPTAADIVNQCPEGELADIIHEYGEERRARRIAKAIVAARKDAPITRTLQLAEIVRGCFPPPRASETARIDPATRTFQALRIYVNDELGELERGLAAAERLLSAEGRLAVVSFHSLEDRIVKNFLTRESGLSARGSRHLPARGEEPEPAFALLSRRPVRPGEVETQANPRARSARLRIARRTAAPIADGGARP